MRRLSAPDRPVPRGPKDVFRWGRWSVRIDHFSVMCAAARGYLPGTVFPGADTSDFAGSVRCDAVGEGLFSAVALEMDPGTRIFATLPVVPVPEMPDRE